ncbi:MAG: hypothetical protein R3E86_01830 [Pseudomonadales bacterium]
MNRSGLVLLALLACQAASAWELDARLKYFGSVAALPEDDLQRIETGTPDYADGADLRLMFRTQRDGLSLIVDHSTTLLRSDVLNSARAPGLTLDQSATGDDRRLADLTWTLDGGGRHVLLHRFDRLALRYQGRNWRVTAGREAVSWGNGLVFQPLDLFNPFAPTTVDTDYKTGDDLLLVERLFDDGSDLQLLAVGRRDVDHEVSAGASSFAGKWHGFMGEGELELVAARHFRDQVYGTAVRWPLGGALLRSDLVATRLESGTWKLSGIVNLDYSLVIGQRNLYLFGEYFHSSFGVRELPDDPTGYPQALRDRVQRGELFNLMRDYLALGGTLEWHPLWNQTLLLITNLNDGSVLGQTQIAFERGDHQRLELGVVHAFGDPGEEFGGVPVATLPPELPGQPLRQITSGGGTRGYLRWVYYF